jgi:hypothetical protein
MARRPMTTRFHLDVQYVEALEIERWLNVNIGPQVKEIIPKKNIKIMNWESRFQFSTDWHTKQLMVEIFDDRDAMVFKLAWSEQILRNKDVKSDWQ